jgi:putative ABC transport system permease protein
MCSDWREYVKARLPPLNVRAERESEIVEELAQQLESAYDAAVDAGADPREAAQRASSEVADWRALATTLEAIESGGAATTALYPTAGASLMTDFFQDVRYAARSLGRTPGYAAVAVLTLMLGFGLATVAFSIIDGVLLRPLGYHQSEHLVLLKATVPPDGSETHEITLPDAHDLSRLAVFDGAATIVPFTGTTTVTEPPSQIEGFETSAQLFDVLRIRAPLGRFFQSSDDASQVVISHSFWLRLGAPSDIVGRTLPLNERPRNIIGVAPPGFRIELIPRHAADVFVPLTTSHPFAENRAARFARVVARLSDGVSREQASAATAVLGAQLAQQYPDTNRDRTFAAYSLHDEIVGPVKTQIWLVAALVGLVLLVACANFAGLVTARTVAHARDLVVRMALGAGWWRVVRQSLAESLLITAAGATLGALAAALVLDLVPTLPGITLPRAADITIDHRVVAVLGAGSFATACVVGLMPLLLIRRVRGGSGLRTGHETAGRPATRLRTALVTGQTAFVFLLVATAALLATSLRAVLAQPPGFDTSHVVTMRVGVPVTRYPTRDTTVAFFTGLLDDLRARLGVNAAGVISNLPLAGNTGSTLSIQGREDVPIALRPTVGWHWTSPGYFAAMGMPILKGRDFHAEDVARSPHVTVVNETLARLHFAGEDPIGKRVYFGGIGPAGPVGDQWHEVIGVVGDVRHRALDIEPDARAYDLFGQHWGRTVSLAVRTNAGALHTASLVRGVVAERDPQLAVFSVRTTADLVDGAVATRRTLFWLVTAFAVAGFAIAAIGLYGTLSYIVTQRTREVGVRLALGATTAQIHALVTKRAVQIVLGGIAIGLIAAFAARRIIESQLFGVTALDVPSLVVAVLALLGAALVASALPARRAMKVNPVDALRTE